MLDLSLSSHSSLFVIFQTALKNFLPFLLLQPFISGEPLPAPWYTLVLYEATSPISWPRTPSHCPRRVVFSFDPDRSISPPTRFLSTFPSTLSFMKNNLALLTPESFLHPLFSRWRSLPFYKGLDYVWLFFHVGPDGPHYDHRNESLRDFRIVNWDRRGREVELFTARETWLVSLTIQILNPQCRVYKPLAPPSLSSYYLLSLTLFISLFS